MKYVIIEGNRQKSEAKFWRRLIDFVLDPSVNLLCAEGSSKFKEALDEVASKSKGRDDVLICLDSTANAMHFDTDMKHISDWIYHNPEKASRLCLHYPEEYCFEDCILLLQHFLEWQYPDLNAIDRESLQAYKEYISIDHFKKHTVIKDYLNQNDSALKQWCEKYISKSKWSTCSFEVLAGNALLHFHEKAPVGHVVKYINQLLPFILDEFIQLGIFHQPYILVGVGIHFHQRDFFFLAPIIVANKERIHLVLGVAHRVENGIAQAQKCIVGINGDFALEVVNFIRYYTKFINHLF